MRQIDYYGKTIEFPDTFTDEQIVAVLDQLDQVSKPIDSKSLKLPPDNAERFSMDSKGKFYPDSTGRFYICADGQMSQGNSNLTSVPHTATYTKPPSQLNLRLLSALAGAPPIDGTSVTPKKALSVNSPKSISGMFGF